MFCKASFILSGWTADRTKMRVMTSTLLSGTCSLRSSLVKSHWKAQQRSGQYRGFCCQQKIDYYWKTSVFYKRFNLHFWESGSLEATCLHIRCGSDESYFDEFDSSRWEVTGVNEDVEVVLQQREDAVSNAAAGLQQHQPLGLKLKTTHRRNDDRYQCSCLILHSLNDAKQMWKT